MTQMTPVEQAGKRLVFDDTITVQAPVQEVYTRWTEFTHFPQFMSNVEEVRSIGGDRYHWVARIFGIKQEWDAEVTARDPNSRIAWQSVNGAFNSGSVTFTSAPNNQTEVRLHLEYTPPGGQVGKTIDSVTQATKREMHEDLENFRRLMTGQHRDDDTISEQEIAGEGVNRVLGALAVTALGAGLGALGAALVEDNMRRFPSSVSSAQAKARAWNIAARLGTTGPALPWTERISMPAAVAGWVLTGASAASVIASAALRFSGHKTNALFIGQWAPTFLSMGIFGRIIGTRDVNPGVPASIVSWGFFGGSLGAVLSSATLHSRSNRKEGLFVGQWAPTMMAAAVLSRLFNI